MISTTQAGRDLRVQHNHAQRDPPGPTGVWHPQAALNRAGIPLVAGGAPAEPASSSSSGKRLTSITCDGKDRSPRTRRGQAPSRSARERFPPHSSGRYSRERAHVDMGSHWQRQAGQP